MFRLKFLFIILCCSFASLCHATWTTSPPNSISPIYSFTYGSVFTSCNSTQGVFLATWADGNNNQYPTYSFYTSDTGWSTINTIANSGALITSNVITSSDPVSGKFIGSWTDSTTLHPTASVYSPGIGWSAADSITTSMAAVNTANSFNSTTQQFLITWADTNNNHYPTYSFYTSNAGWSPINTISTASSAANVHTSFDPTTNQFLAVWVDIGTGFPMYSFYASGSWSAATPISNLASVDNDVLCTCNPTTGVFIATWADINQSLFPFYSVYTAGIGWSPIATITTSSGVTDNVTISCDVTTGEYLAAWSNVVNGNPTYSFYKPVTGWSEPAVISTLSRTGSDIMTCFDIVTGQFLAVWADNSNPDLIFNPTYSFFIDPPSPPSSFRGAVMYNRFLTQTDIIHRLEWKPPVDSTTIASYQITRNGVIIARVNATGPLIYLDHNRNNNRVDVYTIVSIDEQGQESPPVSISL